MTETAIQITADMTIGEILGIVPHHSQKIAAALTRSGLHCTSCSAATWETLEAGMLGHGKSESDIVHLLDELNRIANVEIDLTTITLTPRAAEKFKEIAQEDNKTGWALRFGRTVGGCSGFEYLLEFSEKAEPDDQIFESESLKIHVQKSMVKYLLGSVIDYVDGLYGAGFKISNPNAKSSCGCGKSQGY